jgi:hypothetical protein
MKQVTKTDKYTATTETQVRVFWQVANDSTEVTRSLNPDSYETDYSFTVIDNNNFLFWNHQSILDQVYADQGNNQEGTKLFDCQCTLSVGDVIQISESSSAHASNVMYIVAPVGFIKMSIGQFVEWRKTSEEDRSWFARRIYKEGLKI